MIIGGEDCLYLMAQAAGLILLVFYMLQILKGALHILALTNLALGNRMTKTWIYVWKFTDTDCRKFAQYFKVSVMLMLLSFFLVSGIFIEFVLSFADV